MCVFMALHFTKSHHTYAPVAPTPPGDISVTQPEIRKEEKKERSS